MSRRRLFRSLALCLLAAVAIAGATWLLSSSPRRNPADLEHLQLARVVEDPASADADSVDLIRASDFRFAMGDGSGRDGYSVIRIDADGRCSYTFLEWAAESDPKGLADSKQRWKRAEFSLDATTLADFRKLLNKVDFFRLKKEYHAEVEDGTQRWALAEASGKRKTVYCNNYFPPGFLRISRFVNDRIITTHAPAVTDAQTITVDQRDMELENSR